jgi:hypothetical protein
MNYRTIDYLMGVNDGINPYGFVHHYKRNYRMNGGVLLYKDLKGKPEAVKPMAETTLKLMTLEDIKNELDFNEQLLNEEITFKEGSIFQPTEVERNIIITENEKLNQLTGKDFLENIKENDFENFKIIVKRINEGTIKNISQIQKEYKNLTKPIENEFGVQTLGTKQDENEIRNYEDVMTDTDNKGKKLTLMQYGQTIENVDFKELFYFEDKTEEEKNKEDKLNQRLDNLQTAKNYLMNIYNDETLVNKQLYDKDGTVNPGKKLEYNVCGLNNKNAKKLYVQNPNIRVSDDLIEQYSRELNAKGVIGKAAASMFPQDNIDIDNQFINEMKDYKNINYYKMLKLNKQKMIMYYRKFEEDKKQIIIDIEELEIDLELEEDLKNRKELKLKNQELKKITKILSETKYFRREFYKNIPYQGITITMSKFDKNLIKPQVNTGVNSDDVIDYIKKGAQPKYNTEMKNSKYIFGYKKETATNKDYDKAMTQKIKENIFNNSDMTPYKLYITTKFSKCTGVYDYSNDDIMGDEYPLNWYKVGHCKSIKPKLNSVKFPIENFIIKK